uniref:Uncharacterized protein n=1 Tax=Oncorhynchus tshawytscha TaxID=74940 RepID=A0A8C8D9B0_ONCTS
YLLLRRQMKSWIPLLCLRETLTKRIIRGQEVQPYSIKYQARCVSAAHCWKPVLIFYHYSRNNIMLIKLSERAQLNGITRIYSYYLSPVLRRCRPYCHYYYYYYYNMICGRTHFGGKDSCIVSWEVSRANPYFPGVYTKVRNNDNPIN